MSRTALVVVTLVLASLLAGCSAKSQSESSSVPPDVQNAKVSDSTGAIRGIVYDQAITPVAGANVTLKVDGKETSKMTSATGAFVFDSLKPGTYFYTVHKLGYTTVQKSSEVKAGQEGQIEKVQIETSSVGMPTAELLKWKAFLECGAWAVAVTTNPCAVVSLLGLQGGSDNVHLMAYGGGKTPDFAQAEAQWDGTQPLGNWLDFSESDGGTGACVSVNAQSPAMFNLTKDQITSCKGNTAKGVTLKIFPGAAPGTPPTPTVVLNQEYHIFMTYFYGYMPPSGWTFVKDGCEKLQFKPLSC